MKERIKQFVFRFNSPSLPLQERLFRMIMTAGLVGLVIGIISGIFSGEDIANTLTLCGAFLFLAIITFVSIRFHKIQMGAVITGMLILFIVMPFNFFTTGGIYGGASLWLLLGIVYVCFLIEKKIKIVLILCGFAVDAACYYIAFYHSEYVVPHTMKMAYSDSFVSMVIVSAVICSMIAFQNAIFKRENKLAQEQKKEIEELNRMQNRFFSSMSHEIRTPINTIIGLNEMILRDNISDEVANDAANIQSASEMLLALINDILDMSKIESGKMDIVSTTYDLGAMLSDLVGMIWSRAKDKGLEFHVDVDQSLPSQLYGDEVRIKQILINMLNNAVKYTSEGSVTLAIQRGRTNNDGMTEVIFSVTDTGMGIKKESIPYLFQAFKRVDEEQNRYIEGTGLGLSIVKQLVDLMGGEISVNSVYRKGSTFVVSLPQRAVTDAPIGELDLETRHAMNRSRHYRQTFEAPNAHVLIVDDNETNLMVAQKLLRDTKVQIDTATSGMECLEKTFDKRYDVILMDHLMPNMDGVTCLHELRSQKGGLNQDVPVVALTANAGSENQEMYRREGFDGYLLKPVTGMNLEMELLRHLPKELVSITSEGAAVGVVENAVVEHRRRRMVMITTDSVCDLPEQMLSSKQVAVMPYRVCTANGEFLDGIETDSDGVLAYLCNNVGEIHSQAPKVVDYEEFFAEQLTKAQYVVHISMARHVSEGYAHALEAAGNFDNVFVIDSGHLSSGMGLLVLRAAQYAAAEKTPEAIVAALEEDRSKISTSFVVDSTEYMARAGRISDSVHTICKSLMLHPVIVLDRSRIKVGSIWIGTRVGTWKRYISAEFCHKREIDQAMLFITYAGMNEQELMDIEKQVREKIDFETIVFQKASPAILTNCGPGSFGLLYMKK
ncbi:MAG: DegV family protein [Lachnospiraceae bacterium]|nr:DegV family protein [bacterium]MDY5516405.1 DegV family protein [Lachnospiraceae bacterium]